ncbi:zinc finger HIT domain-containing protein 2 [Gadus morhua]|nr:zinc finger HIT domain-containing protein 2 [Gadus morhua]
MNHLLRKRLPASVRGLLTDIGPKEESLCSEWTDSEPETICNDGILLPSRKTNSNEEFLTPASTHQHHNELTTDSRNTNQGTVCGLCKSKPSCYTCPRCNMPYCCLVCYRSTDHILCSEEFYKQSVLQELKEMGESAAGSRKKMHDILMGLKQKAEETDGGMGNVFREDGLDSDDHEHGQAEILELLSRLSKFQQSGSGYEGEIAGILRRLEEIGEMDDRNAELLGSVSVGDIADEPEEGQNLADRLSGLDIDSLSEEAMWELLNSQEKERFLDLMKGKELEQLVPLWRPWWEAHEEVGGSMVEVLGVEENLDGQIEGVSSCDTTQKTKEGLDHIIDNSALEPVLIGIENKKEGQTKRDEHAILPASTVPPISAKIQMLSSLSSNPSPLVCYGLVNALFGYTFTLTLFNGDVDSLNHEVCDAILDVSEALNSNKIFETVQQALESGEAATLAGGYFDREDPYAKDRAVEAVAHIMTGRSRQDAIGYCLAAFSQLRTALSKAKATLPKGELEEKRRKYFLAGKKCEFYQAWVSENGPHLRSLAIGLWQEHSDRMNRRENLERETRAVEASWKKGKRKGNGPLIKEIN